jgi:hypothetical protein
MRESKDLMSAFHPDLTLGRFLPNVSYGRLASRIVRSAPFKPGDKAFGMLPRA